MQAWPPFRRGRDAVLAVFRHQCAALARGGACGEPGTALEAVIQ